MLKYESYFVVFQEVPNEVTLGINVSGCPYKCKGCHSPFLWKDEGTPLLDNLENIIKLYENLITCVCFFGGDHNESDLIKCLKICKKYKLKTCLYSGHGDGKPYHTSEEAEKELEYFNTYMQYLDYLKIGRYNYLKGGLNSKNTNQIFYKIVHFDNNSTRNYKIYDITSLFYNK